MTKGKRKQLKRKPNDLREKVDLLNDSAYALCRSNPAKAETTALKAYEKAKRIRYQRGRARAAQITGISHGIRGNYSQALNHFSESLKIREGVGDEKLIANTQHTIGNVHWLMGDYENALKNYSTLMTGGIVIPSSTAPTAGTVLPSPVISPMTGKIPPWIALSCAMPV